MKQFLNKNSLWLTLAIVITLTCGLIYSVAQQSLRSSANDPQIQLSEDLANAVSQGQPLPSTSPTSMVDLKKSLATFVIQYDENGIAGYSDATLDGKTPSLPDSVLTDTRQKGETRFTWEPKPGVRIASVVNHYKGQQSGFILVGRSLKEVEIREDDIKNIVLIGWLITLIVSLVAVKYLKAIGKRPI